jgi:rubrerythrin
MDAKDRTNTLNVALTNEMREREFYLKQAGRTKNMLGKAMFQQIGDDELDHYERLQELHQKWEKEGRWPASLPLEVRGTKVKEVLVEFINRVENPEAGSAQADADDLRAVQIALEFEAKGTKFYAELRDSVSDPKERQFFDLLSRMENEHYLSLRDTEEYFTDPKSWYRKTEHYTLDGE